MEQTQKLREYLARTKGARYPFEGHTLAELEDYLKNLYVKHLAMILCCGGDVSQEQTLFLQRLITGCECEYDLETYMRQGQEATPESLEELLDTITSDKMRDSFLLDALLLVHLGPQSEIREEFLAALCEACELRVAELEQLAGLCGKILRLELCGCIETEFWPYRWIMEERWKPYFPDTVTPECKNTDDFLIAAAGKLTPLDVTTAMPAEEFTMAVSDVNYNNAKCVAFRHNKTAYFYNLKIYMNAHLRFVDVERAVFLNCIFVGDGEQKACNSSSLWFFNCGKVEFKHCSFINFGGRVIQAVNCHKISVLYCKFTDCVMNYNNIIENWLELGGVIYSNNKETPLDLTASSFTNCGGCNDRNYYRSSVISNCTAKIYSCDFKNCWHVRSTLSGRGKDPENSKRCLFMHIREEHDNTLTDSAELGPH